MNPAAVLNNAKFILVVCIVVAQLLIPLQTSRWFSWWYQGVQYTFVMPTFVFLLGYDTEVDPGVLGGVDSIIKAIVSYVLAQTLWLVLARYDWDGLWRKTCYGKIIAWNGFLYTSANPNHGETWKLEDWGKPYFHLWLFFALAVWRLLMPLWWRIRFPVVTCWILSAFFCAFHAYRTFTLDSWMVDIELLVGWFPIFCLGVAARQRRWKLSDSWWSIPVGIGAMACFAGIPVLFPAPGLWGNAVVWAYTAGQEVLSPLTGDGVKGNFAKFELRLAVPLVHGLLVWSFLHLVPRRELWIVTPGGARALACYLLAPLLGCLASVFGAYGEACQADSAPLWTEPAILVYALAATLVLTSWPAWLALRLVVDPPLNWLLTPSAH